MFVSGPRFLPRQSSSTFSSEMRRSVPHFPFLHATTRVSWRNITRVTSSQTHPAAFGARCNVPDVTVGRGRAVNDVQAASQVCSRVRLCESSKVSTRCTVPVAEALISAPPSARTLVADSHSSLLRRRTSRQSGMSSSSSSSSNHAASSTSPSHSSFAVAGSETLDALVAASVDDVA